MAVAPKEAGDGEGLLVRGFTALGAAERGVLAAGAEGAAVPEGAAACKSANPRSRRISDWTLSSTSVNWLGMLNPSFLQRSRISLLGSPSSFANSKIRLAMSG